MTNQHDPVQDGERSDKGRLEISPHAVARVASQAVLRSYGVVGMATANLASDIAATLSRDPTRGVRVHYENSHLIIDLYVIVEYGTRISTIAQNIIDAVRYDVEKTTGNPVAQVNIHVQGLRVSDT
jgi:uncharacterized alkaline shock family protein YloU